MGMWSILEEGRDDYGRGFGMRGGVNWRRLTGKVAGMVMKRP